MLGHRPLGTGPLSSIEPIHTSGTLAATEPADTVVITGSIASRPAPPREAKLLLRYALPRKHQEHIIGDLEEAYYTEWLPEHGPRQARRLYWWHATRSIAPMLWTAAKTSGIITVIVGAAQWLFGTRGS
jgi:hypothetical protein